MKPQHLDALCEVLDFLGGIHEPNNIKIWSRIMEKIAAALHAEAAVYFFADPVASQLVPLYRLGEDNTKTNAKEIPIGKGLVGWVAKFREATLLENSSQDDRFDPQIDNAPGLETPSVIALPLFVNLEFVGAFEFFKNKSKPFSNEDKKLAQTISSQTSNTIRRLQLENMVNRVTSYNASILDNLSGGFLALDLQGRVMICNPAARHILNITGDVIDVPVEKVLSDVPELALVLRKTLSSKELAKRKEISWMNGEQRCVLGYSTLLIKDTHGAFSGVGITFQDITSLKK